MTSGNRDEEILEHIGRYRLSIRQVLRDLFFETDAAAANVIQRLTKSRRLQPVRGLKGGLSYYQLTTDECRKRSLPENRGENLGPFALHEALAVLWFCCMAPTKRKRLEEESVRKRLAELRIEHPHCFEPASGRLYRVYVPSSTSGYESIIRTLRKHTADVYQDKTASEWLTNGDYAFVILVETLSRKQQLEENLSQEQFPTGTHIAVEVAAGPSSLAEMLKERAQPDPE